MSNQKKNTARPAISDQADMVRTARFAAKDFYEFAADLTRQGIEAQLASEQRIADTVQSAVGAVSMLASTVLESRQGERVSRREFGKDLLEMTAQQVRETVVAAHQGHMAATQMELNHQLEMERLRVELEKHKIQLDAQKLKARKAELRAERARYELPSYTNGAAHPESE